VLGHVVRIPVPAGAADTIIADPAGMGDGIDPERYLEERVSQYRGWYDRRARTCKRWHLWLRVCVLAGAAATPALVNLGGGAARASATAVSLVVVAALALDSMLRLREQWSNYRATEQYLDRERFLFGTRAGPYRGLTDEHAFHRFVERVEWAIATENATTLSTMSLSPEARTNGGSA
jgi:hypothetical protein